MVFTRTKIVSLTVILLGGLSWYFFMRDTETVTALATVRVSTGSIISTVKTTGKISPIQTSILSFTRQGTISKVYKKVGDEVKAGEVIAEIDAGNAYLDIESARLSLSNARNSYNKLLEGASLTDKIRAENTLTESRARLTLLEKTLENLEIEERNALADKVSSITTLEQKVEIAEGELEYAEKNIETDTSTSDIERDTDNAYLALQDIDRIMPDIIKGTKDILHIEDKNSPFYGDFSSKDPGFKTKAEAAYTTLVADYAKYKSELLVLSNESPRTFSGTLDLMNHAKTFLDSYATLVGSTIIYAIDASPETEYFPSTLHDSYKTTLRGYASTLTTKLSNINSSLSTLKSYGTDSLQKLAEKNTTLQKRSSLTSAKNELITAKAALEQLRKSYRTKILSAVEDIESQKNTIRLNEATYNDTMDGAEGTDLISARNSVKSAEINLEKSKLSLEEYQIIAPFDGIINDIPWESGDSTLATEGILIENKDMYEIVLSLDQIDIVKIREGMSAKIILDAFPKETYTGSVARISAVPTETSGVVSYEATVVLTIPREDIYSKMSAIVELILVEKNNIILLPTSAITSREGKAYIQVSSRGGTSIEREVTLGISEGGKTEILSGATVGERVTTTTVARTSASGGTNVPSVRRAGGFGGPPGF